MSDTTRRAVLAGAAGVGAATVLAACGDDGADTDDTGGANPPPADPTTADTGSAPASGGAAGALAAKASVPVGGGLIVSAQKVVITQPVAGQFKAFSATCTHQGCTVGDVTGGTINCPCHNSKFDIKDGSVKAGPANKPLAVVPIKTDGDSITMG